MVSGNGALHRRQKAATGVLMTRSKQDLNSIDRGRSLGNRPEALHWFDFICPFCYVSQDRDELLVEAGFDVADLPFQAHREIPAEGVRVGPRRGEMYEDLERQARNAGLELNWPERLPNSRTALAASAWVRRQHPGIARQFNAKLFAAHFVLGQDLGDAGLLTGYANELGADVMALRNALADGSAFYAVSESEARALDHGVRGTPAWLFGGSLIEGAIPSDEFRRRLDEVLGGPA
jgi:predicted DsbA family dithiol-disulfide isomerase